MTTRRTRRRRGCGSAAARAARGRERLLEERARANRVVHRDDDWIADDLDDAPPLEEARRRLRIRRRDGRTCQYCGIVCDENAPVTARFLLTYDHVVPKGRGGHWTSINNLVIACQSCNSRKADRMPWEAGMWPANGVRGVWTTGQRVISLEKERRPTRSTRD